jgi:hypothetical protein
MTNPEQPPSKEALAAAIETLRQIMRANGYAQFDLTLTKDGGDEQNWRKEAWLDAFRPARPPADAHWWDIALRDFSNEHGASGAQWNISALLDHFRKVAPASQPADAVGDVEAVARAIHDAADNPFAIFEDMRPMRERQAQAAIAAMGARMDKLPKPTWFYHPDHTDKCLYSPHEVIDDYYDPLPGNHVFEVECATSLPSIWCAVRVTDDPDADERFTYTEHATEEEARQALEEDQ